LIEMIHRNGKLHLRTLLPEEDSLSSRMLKTVEPYFAGNSFSPEKLVVIPQQDSHFEWTENLSNVDASKLGTWLISPAINPELGERSLYVRISDLLAKKFKKQELTPLSGFDLFITPGK
jgi:hypothetical protein